MGPLVGAQHAIHEASPDWEISVIVTTYNRPDALDAVLRGLARQNDREFEVIIADDGSNPAASEALQAEAARFEFPMEYVWHEDRGFRLAEIRNRAILASHGSYCIFLDGDCIPRPDFIAAHRRLAERGWFVCGNRSLLSRALTDRLLGEGIEPEHWNIATWLRLRLAGHINRIAPLLSLPLGPLRRRKGTNWRAARGSNLAVWRADLDRVDGFDASYTGWGLEDSDFLIRLMRAGVRRKDGRFATGVLHLWHPNSDQTALSQNQRRLDEVLRGDRVRAIMGLSSLSASSERRV